MPRIMSATAVLAFALALGACPALWAEGADSAPATQPADASAQPAQPPVVETPPADAAVAIPPAAGQPGLKDWLMNPAGARLELGAFLSLNTDPSTQGPEPIAGSLDTYTSLPYFKASSLGLGLEYDLGHAFSFEPGLQLSYESEQASYFWTGTRPVPRDSSMRDANVLGLLLDFPFSFNLDLGKSSRIALGLGPSFHFRYGLKAAPDVDTASVDAINSWFWGKARFLTLVSPIRYEHAVSDRHRLGAVLSIRWPLYSLWANEVGIFDQTMVSLSVTLRRSLGE